MLASTTRETSPLLIIEFLHRVFEIFEEYFGTVEESTIKDNFSLVYQLLEEMMDFGYPLTTEPNALKAMIKPPSIMNKILNTAAMGGSAISDVLPDGTISNMPWRKTGVKYAQNEIYMDVIEEIDAMLDKNGNLITSEVSGSIMGNSKLSGVPDLSLSFVDPFLIDDCSFHPCVRYNRFERDKVVSFVPPDGVFELMKYRVNCGPVSAPCYCQPQLSFDFVNNQCSISIIIGARTQNTLIFPGNKRPPLVVEEVVIVIPFSRLVRTANLKATVGTVLFDEASKVAKWNVGKLVPEKYPQLTGTILLQPHSNSSGSLNTLSNSSNIFSLGMNSASTNGSAYNENTVAPVVEMHWKVPMASVSGIAVSSLQMTNERYKPYKGVRTVAKSGKFLIRTG